MRNSKPILLAEDDNVDAIMTQITAFTDHHRLEIKSGSNLCFIFSLSWYCDCPRSDHVFDTVRSTNINKGLDLLLGPAYFDHNKLLPDIKISYTVGKSQRPLLAAQS